MARIWTLLPTWAVVVLVTVVPAVLLMPHDTRIFVAVAGVGGGLVGYVLRLLGSGLFTDPGWRRPSRRRLPRLVGRREYVVPAELPPPPGLLVGRDSEVNRVIDHLARPPGDVPRVVVISGSAGVGKSALAISVAQRLTERYQDGQLLARLDRATTEEALTDVLRTFVKALGRPSDKVPDDTVRLARRYHELTSGGRVLVILDAATNVADVERLLPQGRGCAALVTTRERWPQTAGWLPIEIGRLDDSAGLRMLDALVGGERVEDEVPARRIVEAAAGNPFALQVAGLALAARRDWTLRLAVQRMMEVALPREHGDELPAFTPALNLAYALLTEQERRGFALLGLIDETTFARWAFGALLRGAERGGSARVPATDAIAERILDRLVRVGLIQRHIDDASGMPTFHLPDQIRSYVRARMMADLDPATCTRAAVELAAERRSRGERSAEQLLREQVFDRLQAGELSAALTTAHEALALCGEQMQRARSDAERENALGERGLALAALAEVKAELGWLEEARQYAEEARQHAEEARGTANAKCPPRAMRCLGVVERRLHRLDVAVGWLAKAEVAARDIRDRSELIRILRDQALVRVLRKENDLAAPALAEAKQLCDESGESGRRHLPGVLWVKGASLMADKQYDEAEATLAAAEVMCAAAAPSLKLWQAWIRHQRALVALDNGRHGRSRELALRASEDFRDMHHRYGIAHCRLVIGRALLREESYAAAIAMLEEALQTFVGCGDRWAEADTRLPLAEALQHAGRMEEALTALIQAAQDFDDLRDSANRAIARRRQGAVERDLREAADDRRGRRKVPQLTGQRGRGGDDATLA